MGKPCECCGAAGVQMDGPKEGVWIPIGIGCSVCRLAENEDTWVVWCRTHGKALYPNDSQGAYWDYEKGVPK